MNLAKKVRNKLASKEREVMKIVRGKAKVNSMPKVYEAEMKIQQQAFPKSKRCTKCKMDMTYVPKHITPTSRVVKEHYYCPNCLND